MSARNYRTVFLGSSALALLFALGGPASAQDTNAPGGECTGRHLVKSRIDGVAVAGDQGDGSAPRSGATAKAKAG